MDLVNKGKDMMSGNKSSSHTGGQQSSGGKDYLDKAVDGAEAKFGFDKDHKYDKYEEKGTDFARGQFEKSSGKNVPDKVSN